MSTISNDLLNNDEEIKPVLSSTLNVLTILTIIGCVLGGLFIACTSLIYDFSLKMMDKATASGKEFSAKEIADMEKGRAAIELGKQHLVPTIIIGLVGVALCFVGALWMRKLKKDGFWMYVVGELAPIIASFFIMGSAQFGGPVSMVIGFGIPLVFILLYATQRKNLVY